MRALRASLRAKRGWTTEQGCSYMGWRFDLCVMKSDDDRSHLYEVETCDFLHSAHTRGQLRAMNRLAADHAHYAVYLVVPGRCLGDARDLLSLHFGSTKIRLLAI